jgi:hypothetical protein
MTNTSKTIALAEKLHNVVYTDPKDIEYVTTSARYGRQNLNSRQYWFNGFNYGNNYEAYKEAMDIMGYDPNNIIDVDYIEYHGNKTAAWELYGKTLRDIAQADSDIFPMSQKQKLREMKIEGERLLRLKSKASHERGQALLDEVNDPKWVALQAKQDKARKATNIVNSFAWRNSHVDLEVIKESFKTTGKYTYKTNWK